MSGLNIAQGKKPGKEFPFISEWVTTSDNFNIKIGVAGTYDCRIDWGDGNKETFRGSPSFIEHVYTTAGTYTVSITGKFPRIYMLRNGSTRGNLRKVLDLGDVGWTNWFHAFGNCTLLTSIYRTPGLPNVASSSFEKFLISAYGITSIPPLKDMVDKITSFYYCFRRNYQLVEVDTRGVNCHFSSSSALYIAFNSDSKLERVLGADNLILGSTNRIDQMARGCSRLEEFGTANWSTGNLRYWSNAFSGCYNVKIDYRNWNIFRADNLGFLSDTLRDDDIWSDALIYWATLNFTKIVGIRSPGNGSCKFRKDAIWAREKLKLTRTITDAGPQEEFTSLELVVNVTNQNSFTLPAENVGTYDATIEWGDGTSSSITSYNDPNLSHTYPSFGEYIISVSGDFPKLNFSNSNYKDRLVAIANWGSYGESNTDSSNSFEGCSNLIFVAGDSSFPLCTNTDSMFKGCGAINNVDTTPQTTDTTVYDSSGSAVRSVSGTIPGNWARYDADVRGISFGSNVTSIGSAAFRQHDCNEINIPSNVTYISNDAFFQASQIGITLNFSEGLETISNSAFQSGQYGGDIILPTTLTSIGTNAFSALNGNTVERRYYVNSPASIFTGSQSMRFHQICTIYVHPDYLAEYDSAWRSTHAQEGITVKEWKTYPIPVSDERIAIKDGFDLESSTDVSNLFSGSMVESLPSSLTLSNALTANSIFNGCKNLKSLPTDLTLDSVTTGTDMFSGCKFIQSTAGLILSNLSDFTNTFFDCSSLVNIGTDLSPTNMNDGTGMFTGVAATTLSYSDFIKKLDSINTNTNVTFDGGSSLYDSSSRTSYSNLTDTKGWNISDGGFDASTSDYITEQTFLQPVSRWKLDEDSGSVAIDDISSNNGDYANVDGQEWASSSGSRDYDSALTGTISPTFNPTGNGRVVNCGQAGEFSFIPKTGVFTIESLVRLDGNLSSDYVWRILGTNILTSQVGFGFMFDNLVASGSPSALRLYVTNGSGTASYNSFDTSGFVWDNDWHHVVVTGDGTNVKFYIDGVESNGSVGIGSLATSDITSPLSLADFTHTSQLDTLEGGLQNVTIYDTTLTPSEISSLYTSSTTFEYKVELPVPVAYHDLVNTSGKDGIGSLDFTTVSNCYVTQYGSPDGSSNCLSMGHNGYMNLSANPTSLGYSDAYTFNIWAKFDSLRTGLWGNWVMNWRGSSATPKFAQIIYSSANNDGPTESLYGGDNEFANVISADDIQVEADRWYMLTLTQDSSENESKFYVDGVLQGTGTPVNSTFPNSNLNLTLGVAAWSFSFDETKFAGSLFGNGMWNTPLNTSNISWLYNSGAGRKSAELLPKPPIENLKSWYEFEQDSTDSHSGGYNLTSTGISYGASRNGGNGAVFTSSNSSIKGTASFPTGEHTLACWFKPNASDPSGSGYGLVGNWVGDGNQRKSLLYLEGSGRARFIVSGNGAGAVSPFAETSSQYLTPQTWYHLAGVYDPVNLKHKLYINGELVASQPAPSTLDVTSNYLEIGTWNNGYATSNASGIIDDACVFDKALNIQEIKWLASSEGKYQNL